MAAVGLRRLGRCRLRRDGVDDRLGEVVLVVEHLLGEAEVELDELSGLGQGVSERNARTVLGQDAFDGLDDRADGVDDGHLDLLDDLEDLVLCGRHGVGDGRHRW